LNLGTLSPNPWDLSLCGKNGRWALSRLDPVRLPLVGAGRPANSVGRRASPSPPFPRLSRRSGRIPALPYPPLSCDQYSRHAFLSPRECDLAWYRPRRNQQLRRRRALAY